jgi:hypothetical protein
MVDAFYGPNIDTVEGTLIDNTDDLKENRTNRRDRAAGRRS